MLCSNSKQSFDKSIRNIANTFTFKFLPIHKSVYGNIRCIAQPRQSR